MGWLARPCVHGVMLRWREAARCVALLVEAVARLLRAVPLVQPRVVVAPFAAFEGNCAADLTARSKISALRIHASALLSWARAWARWIGSSRSAITFRIT